MLIDAARSWNGKLSLEEVELYGHGIIPININNII